MYIQKIQVRQEQAHKNGQNKFKEEGNNVDVFTRTNRTWVKLEHK